MPGRAMERHKPPADWEPALSRGSAGPFCPPPPQKKPCHFVGERTHLDKSPFSDEKAWANPNGKRRAGGGVAEVGVLKITRRTSLALRMAEKGRAGQPPQKRAGLLASARGHAPKSRCRLRKSAAFPQTVRGNGSRCKTRVTPCLRRQKSPFRPPPPWPDNIDRQPGPVKLQMCAVSVVFLLQGSASLCCEREPSSDSGKHINACFKFLVFQQKHTLTSNGLQ